MKEIPEPLVSFADTLIYIELLYVPFAGVGLENATFGAIVSITIVLFSVLLTYYPSDMFAPRV